MTQISSLVMEISTTANPGELSIDSKALFASLERLNLFKISTHDQERVFTYVSPNYVSNITQNLRIRNVRLSQVQTLLMQGGNTSMRFNIHF